MNPICISHFPSVSWNLRYWANRKSLWWVQQPHREHLRKEVMWPGVSSNCSSRHENHRRRAKYIIDAVCSSDSTTKSMKNVLARHTNVGHFSMTRCEQQWYIHSLAATANDDPFLSVYCHYRVSVLGHVKNHHRQSHKKKTSWLFHRRQSTPAKPTVLPIEQTGILPLSTAPMICSGGHCQSFRHDMRNE